MMINGMEGDKAAKPEGQSFTKRDNSIFVLEEPETRSFMYPPPLPQPFMEYHKISLNLLKNKPYIRPKLTSTCQC